MCILCLEHADGLCLSLQGFKQQALAVSTDPEHRFELALQLGELKIAYQLAVEAEVRACWPAFEANSIPHHTNFLPQTLPENSQRLTVHF